jgi:hypothetical protein
VLTLSDVVDPWSGILEGDYVSFFESEHEGKQVMFGIGGVIMMLDLRISGSVGDNFVRLSEVVIAVDMLLKKIKISDIAMCIEYSASLGKTHLRHLALRERGGD